jgi:hypothetical protein
MNVVTVAPLLPVLLTSPIHPPVKGNVELMLTVKGRVVQTCSAPQKDVALGGGSKTGTPAALCDCCHLPRGDRRDRVAQASAVAGAEFRSRANGHFRPLGLWIHGAHRLGQRVHGDHRLSQQADVLIRVSLSASPDGVRQERLPNASPVAEPDVWRPRSGPGGAEQQVFEVIDARVVEPKTAQQR